MASDDKKITGDAPTPTPDPEAKDPPEEKEDREEELGGRMSFIEHLEELRRRIIVSLVTLVGCFIVIYSTSVDVLKHQLTLPLTNVLEKMHSSMIFTGFAEGFIFDLKVAAVAAVFVASPMIFYQIWAFVAPGLYKKERRYVGPFIIFSTFFFVAGAAFFYFMVFPLAVGFFSQFAVAGKIKFMPKLDEVFSFITMMAFAFGLAFELPVVAFILARLHVINVSMLNKYRKYAVLIIMVLAAVLTPPDVLSQLLLAGPMWALYELSVIVTWIFGPKRKKEEEADSAEA